MIGSGRFRPSFRRNPWVSMAMERLLKAMDSHTNVQCILVPIRGTHAVVEFPPAGLTRCDRRVGEMSLAPPLTK